MVSSLPCCHAAMVEAHCSLAMVASMESDSMTEQQAAEAMWRAVSEADAREAKLLRIAEKSHRMALEDFRKILKQETP